jgi:prevent-host-death family protein
MAAMDKTISAADANRRFSEILRGAREGVSYVVTSHGKPVARILPIEQSASADDAQRRLVERLMRQPVRRAKRWTRDELYED